MIGFHKRGYIYIGITSQMLLWYLVFIDNANELNAVSLLSQRINSGFPENKGLDFPYTVVWERGMSKLLATYLLTTSLSCIIPKSHHINSIAACQLFIVYVTMVVIAIYNDLFFSINSVQFAWTKGLFVAVLLVIVAVNMSKQIIQSMFLIILSVVCFVYAFAIDYDYRHHGHKYYGFLQEWRLYIIAGIVIFFFIVAHYSSKVRISRDK